MFCHNCGKQIPDGIKFCPYCGASLQKQEIPNIETVSKDNAPSVSESNFKEIKQYSNVTIPAYNSSRREYIAPSEIKKKKTNGIVREIARITAGVFFGIVILIVIAVSPIGKMITGAYFPEVTEGTEEIETTNVSDTVSPESTSVAQESIADTEMDPLTLVAQTALTKEILNLNNTYVRSAKAKALLEYMDAGDNQPHQYHYITAEDEITEGLVDKAGDLDGDEKYDVINVDIEDPNTIICDPDVKDMSDLVDEGLQSLNNSYIRAGIALAATEFIAAGGNEPLNYYYTVSDGSIQEGTSEQAGDLDGDGKYDVINITVKSMDEFITDPQLSE